ncbi:MAG TPA: ABC transporter ATP-binding protein [Gemmatimonadales bacterium]|nr:ABC transporter ATP-binding protein [Gemmatimonadales bacterium]
MSTFTLRDVRVRYPAQDGWALDGVDLDIAPAKVTWITGALGSGTSTLLLALAGLAPRLTGGAREGIVRDRGNDPATTSPLTRRVAYLGPSPMLQLSGIAATVRDEVAVGPMNLGWAADRIRIAVAEALARLDVAHLAERAPGALSGGETQRVLLAALLAADPLVWLLDEPFSALDFPSRVAAGTLLRTVAAAGATVVIASDDADTMADVADRLIALEHGRIALSGDPHQLLRGDALLAVGAGSTDAATLAALAGIAEPRPDTTPELLALINGRSIRPALTAPIARTSPASHSTPLLAFDGVHFGYRDGAPVLDNLTLAVGAGDAVAVFGANGAGKSTLLRLAMALEHPTRGTVRVLGDVTSGRHPEDFAPRSGFLFQQPERQLFAASVRAECAIAPRRAGWSPAQIALAVAEVLEQLGLVDVADAHPYDLPLPRRRLVALAAILAATPELLLLDEPTAGLDGPSRDAVIRVVREWVSQGRAVVAVTHDPFFAHEALDRAILLRGGRAVHDGPVQDVLDESRLPRPAALAVARILGMPAGRDRQQEVAAAIRGS